MKFRVHSGVRQVSQDMVDDLVSEFRSTHNETHEYILIEALKTHDVYLPFTNTNRTLLIVDRSTNEGVLVNGTVFGGSVNAMAKQLSADKLTSQQMAEQCEIPTLKAKILQDQEDALNFWNEQSGVCILKPFDGRMGKDVYMYFRDEQHYLSTYQTLAEKGKVLAQQRAHSPYDLRMLCIGGKFAAAAVRKAYCVTGDGSSTFKELMLAQNARRADIAAEKPETAPLKYIDPDEMSALHGIDENAVIEQNTRIQLTTSNVAQGGTIIEVSDSVHPWFIEKGEQLAQFFGFDVMSIDFITEDIDSNHDKLPKAYFIETNARPNLVLHHRPHEGPVRNAARLYLDYVFSSPKAQRYTVMGEKS